MPQQFVVSVKIQGEVDSFIRDINLAADAIESLGASALSASDGLKRLTGDLGSTAAILDQAARENLAKLDDYLRSATEAATGWVGTLSDSISQGMDAASDAMGAGVDGVINELKIGVDEMDSVLDRIAANVKEKIQALSSDITNITNELAAQFGSDFDEGGNNALQALESFKSDAISILGELERFIRSEVINAFGQIPGEVTNAGAETLDVLQTLCDQIRSLLQGLVADGFGYGRGFVDELRRGMESSWSALVDWLRDQLGDLGDYFNQSPAKKGPLRDVEQWGKGFWEQYGYGSTQGAEAFLGAMRGMLGELRQIALPQQVLAPNNYQQDQRSYYNYNISIDGSLARSGNATSNMREREILERLRELINHGY